MATEPRGNWPDGKENFMNINITCMLSILQIFCMVSPNPARRIVNPGLSLVCDLTSRANSPLPLLLTEIVADGLRHIYQRLDFDLH
jgi:hypothetical protein